MLQGWIENSRHWSLPVLQDFDIGIDTNVRLVGVLAKIPMLREFPMSALNPA